MMKKKQLPWFILALTSMISWQPAEGLVASSRDGPTAFQMHTKSHKTLGRGSSLFSRLDPQDPSGQQSQLSSRRQWLEKSALALPAILTFHPLASQATEDPMTPFRTKAYNLKEYTNSIVASKDTNVSPKEAYDVLAETIAPIGRKKSGSGAKNNPNRNRALDVGAGAGVSTQTLYEMGFTDMDAVDWSGLAWEGNVVECPPSVKFFEMDDERFFRNQRRDNPNVRYHTIVYNFAINLDKAQQIAKEFLDPDLEDARLLAPANAQKDYWYKQTYYLIDAKGDIIWKSKPDVGAWSVQFQPDVTSDTCQGIWCPPYNGFVKQR
ncbi:expressed unknown protein [Seminavis robusta]|uniref:Uncharacterized protein n=1 Tax=Seminavis robusta TaxID=568900 RepID=A0A9N8E4F4_9STRA|nr:expressed unknown protein [Seminavis robusta]|eukprot:Sro654_g182160.1 n/a (322) ;mRNA; r:49992-50957